MKPSIEEGIGRALAKGDLTPREGPCSLDRVTALGMVGIRESMADAIYRLKYGGDPKAYRDALSAVTKLARNLNGKEGWNLGSRLPGMAKSVLDYWLADVCPACTGKRDNPDDATGLTSQPIVGTPSLEGLACDACRGSGKRPWPWLSEKRRVMECSTALFMAVLDTEGRIRDRLISKLSQQIRAAGS